MGIHSSYECSYRRAILCAANSGPPLTILCTSCEVCWRVAGCMRWSSRAVPSWATPGVLLTRVLYRKREWPQGIRDRGRGDERSDSSGAVPVAPRDYAAVREEPRDDPGGRSRARSAKPAISWRATARSPDLHPATSWPSAPPARTGSCRRRTTTRARGPRRCWWKDRAGGSSAGARATRISSSPSCELRP